MSSKDPNKTRKITTNELVKIITNQCDVESLCSDDAITAFLSGAEEVDATTGTGTGVGITADFSGLSSANQFFIDNRQKQEKVQQDPVNKTTNSDLAFAGTSFGKKKLYVSFDILGKTYGEYITQRNKIETSFSLLSSGDPYRGALGAYWSLGKDNKTLNFLRFDSRVETSSGLSFITLEQNISLSQDYMLTSDFGQSVERYRLDYSPKTGEEIRKFYPNQQEYLSPLFRIDTRYIDTEFFFFSPYSEKELQETEKPVSSLTYRISPDYSFYIKNYERKIIEQDIPEHHLPSLYILAMKQKYENIPEEIERMFSLEDTIPTKTIANTSIQNEEEKEIVGQYFEEYVNLYRTTKPEFKNEVLNKARNIIFPYNMTSSLLSFNEKKRNYPMYVELKFSANKYTKFCSILQTSKLVDKVVAVVADKVNKDEFEDISFLAEKVDTKRNSEISNFITFKTTEQENIRYIEFDSVLKEILGTGLLDGQTTIQSIENLIDTSNTIELSSKEETGNASIEERELTNTLYYSIFKNKVSNLLNQVFRTHEDILNGKVCYNETFMYRIAKYKGSKAVGEPVQNIYLCNTADLDYMEYIDTQVKYDTIYTYKVFAYQVVIANKYRYSDFEFEVFGSYTVENEPYLMIAEVPFFSKTTTVYDSPPAPPEINFTTYQGNPDSILVLMNSSVNTYKKKPTIIEQEDISIFQKISQKQEKQFGEQIEFSSDDTIKQYQVYRIERKPEKYDDFSGNILTTVDTLVDKKLDLRASSASLLDKISPNKKYYYMFRAIDIHDKPSNPSEVYEVEIINEKGMVFPIIRAIELREIKNSTTKKPVKRFLQIVPSVLQAVLNEDNEQYQQQPTARDAISYAKLGITDNLVWGKKFKIRIVSKQTKKVLDFNVKFDFIAEK